MKMSYDECLEFLYRQLPMYQRDGSVAFKKDLSNTLALCEALGNPQDRIQLVHVAGTNGKGSVSHMMAAAMQAEGYQVGLYTSPHYYDFRERIKINGVYIDPESVVRFVDKVRILLDEIQPSFFELTVAMAFDYFANENVDYAIIETGLGGRLDSTNVIKPMLSVITNISLDHQSMLGETHAEIAMEKAGIIKEATPVVIGERHAETDQVFQDRAALLHASIYFAEDGMDFTDVELLKDAIMLKTSIRANDEVHQVKLGLSGAYQLKNLRTSLYALNVLCETKKVCLHTDRVLHGLENIVDLTKLQGRWQVLSSQPLIIADSGHNSGGLRLTIQQLLSMSYDRLRIVFGASGDKSIAEMLALLPKDAIYYWCAAGLARAMPSQELRKEGAVIGLIGNDYPSVSEALLEATKAAGKEDLIFIGGSAFVVGEVIPH